MRKTNGQHPAAEFKILLGNTEQKLQSGREIGKEKEGRVEAKRES